MATTFGIEEEFIFLDPVTLRPADVAEQAFAQLASEPAWAQYTHREFLASQVEHASRVFTELDDAESALGAFRRRIADEATRLGTLVASTGTTPDAHAFPAVAHLERYERIVRDMAGLIADHQFSGLHVHVGVPDREAGVVALNTVRPWLPLLTAMSGNSPFFRGFDTGYESWRTIQLRRWPTAGSPPRFRDANDYDRRIQALLGMAGISDVHLIMWNVRLSEQLPTIEFRMADAQLTAEDTLLIAAVCRGLVEYAIDTAGGPPREADMPAELLSAAVMHAAHTGLRGLMYDPATRDLADARVVLERLLERIGPYLERSGDAPRVADLVARLLQAGTGAIRQRAAFRRGGTEGLERLFAATICNDPDRRAA
ncbi:YbdK family carboxylate-amine ligase [Agromyces intestinalis]|uniref:Putative glutamate--cysteine ligase 2 n=1 Tax=Agromyces intestinalis TaxID=2592652 RepID=A0A5C1YHJ3_9MICO|nr:YbdK family carboxylate-amine ligase [Agromyces intestinalis]QEO14880.1 YbdK family carboxylate-amine ligase [Agromyces intestinalis]